MPHPTPPRALAALALLLLLTAPLARAQPTTHSLDDGSAESTVGWHQAGGSIFFANRFTAAPAGERLTALSVAYGRPGTSASILDGAPVTLFVFRDALGRDVPAQPILLASFPSQVTHPNTNTFHRTDIAPLNVEGHFFVGVFAGDLPQAGRFPVGFDRHNPAGRSFAAFFNTPQTLDDLPSLTFDPTLVTSDGLLVADRNAFLRATDGQFLIRAETVPVPEPSAAGAAALAIGAVVLRRRRA